MPQILDEFYAEKQSIINEMFIATADHNYVLARWSFHHDLNVDFFWLAVHSIEKYLKALLLLNGKSARNYSHNIVALYTTATEIAPELFPAVLVKPDEQMPDEFWRNEKTEKFIARLHRDGQADNRYQIFGYSRHPQDLWKLDQVIFHVRRACKALEAYEFGRPINPALDRSNREALVKSPDQWRLNSKLEDVMSGKQGPELQKASLDWNFPFASVGYEQPEMNYAWATQSPLLARRLFDPLEQGPEAFAHNDALWSWFKDNIHIPKETINEVDKIRAEIKARASKTPEKLGSAQ
jgi:hypothetical protein